MNEFNVEDLITEKFPKEQWESEHEKFINSHINFCTKFLNRVKAFQSKHQFDANEYEKYEDFIQTMSVYIKDEVVEYERRFNRKFKASI